MPDTSGIPSTGTLPSSTTVDRQKKLANWIRAEVKNAISEELRQTYEKLGADSARQQQQVDTLTARLATLQTSVNEWTEAVRQWEQSTKIYENQIYQHISSVDQKIAGSESMRSVSNGMWDVFVEVVIPVRKAAQWITKACLHFESLGPEDRRSPVDGKKIPGAKKERWRDR